MINRRSFVMLGVLAPVLMIAKDFDYCSAGLSKKIMDKENLAQVTIKSKDEDFIRSINLLHLKPYDYVSFLRVFDFIYKDYIENSNKSIISTDKVVLNILLHAFIFTDIRYINLISSKIFEIFNDQKMLSKISKRSYFNYLVLYKIGFFKYKEQEDSFIAEISSNSKDDIVYYWLAVDLFRFRKGDSFELSDKSMRDIANKKTSFFSKCNSQKALNDLRHKVGIYDLLEIVMIASLFKKDRPAILNYYYNLKNGSNILEYLDIYREMSDGKYLSAYNAMKVIYLDEGKPSYFEYDLIKLASVSSTETLLLEDYYQTRFITIDALYVYRDIRVKDSSLMNFLVTLKKNLKVSSEKIINRSLSDNNSKNSNFLIKETRELLNIK